MTKIQLRHNEIPVLPLKSLDAIRSDFMELKKKGEHVKNILWRFIIPVHNVGGSKVCKGKCQFSECPVATGPTQGHRRESWKQWISTWQWKMRNWTEGRGLELQPSEPCHPKGNALVEEAIWDLNQYVQTYPDLNEGMKMWPWTICHPSQLVPYCRHRLQFTFCFTRGDF